MSDIYKALTDVMKDVGAVKKQDKNTHQGYSFRGVDAVVKAVYPALVKHGVSVLPNVTLYEYGTVEVGQGNSRKPMGHARVIVQYTFSAADGSAVVCSAAGEAMDSGDKATPKAMSIALRTALLQALMLPTDDPDPDAESYERASAAPPDPLVEARVHLAEEWKKFHAGELDTDAVTAAYQTWSQGELFANATADKLRQFAASLAEDRSNDPGEDLPGDRP